MDLLCVEPLGRSSNLESACRRRCAATQVTTTEGFEPQESPDGRFLYYLDRALGPVDVRANLVRTGVDGGPQTRVLDNVRAFYWSVAEKGIFILEMERDFDAVEFYDSATGGRTRLGRLPWRASRLCGRISLSLDGRWLATNHVDHLDSNLMLVDNSADSGALLPHGCQHSPSGSPAVQDRMTR
jgi:hypothetical protein